MLERGRERVIKTSTNKMLKGRLKKKSFSEHRGMPAPSMTLPDIAPQLQDAQLLKKALSGWRTDKKALIKILGHKNATQRRKTRDAYHQLCNESLLDRLHSELSGHFGKAMILWTFDPPERDANLARSALRKSKKDAKQLKSIVEIACASSPNHLVAVRQVYSSMFECSLEEDIASNVSLPLRKLLVGLVTSYRNDKGVVDSVVANSEASTLHEAIKAKQLDDDHVVWILSTRNFYQLRETFKYYKKTYGNSIDQDIKSCGNGNLESLLKAVVCCIESPEKHFAEVIWDSVFGLGTDKNSLTRVIVRRAEIDLIKIREEYKKLYEKNIDFAVIDDTSGGYQELLMTLLGARI
ncbi:annexin D3-like [Humulus lupulus]|uniref:annexin D3-like n=1 Tax=Humulus lupulus TaxID=3486 RepID=UPI002B40D53F|nr:annexin D3-like [Humulus lupulus]